MFEINQQFDIRGASFDDFVGFLFEHDIPPEFDRNGRRSDSWYAVADVAFEPKEVTKLYRELFLEPTFLINQYSEKILEQGFWAIMSGLYDCSVREVIWSEEVDFNERSECVRSMFHLYEKLFAVAPLETSSHMWWDSLAYDWHCGNRIRGNGGEDLLMQDVMFETLERILSLQSETCQAAALHGLGHLHHPRTVEVIDDYLIRNPDLESSMTDYAKTASRFKVM